AARLFRIDQLDKQVSILHEGGTRRLTLDPRGDFYLLHTGDGTNTNRLLQYRPPQDSCTDSDLRDRVYAGDVDSGVPNRYAADGWSGPPARAMSAARNRAAPTSTSPSQRARPR